VEDRKCSVVITCPLLLRQAGIPTRLNQWWSSVPFITSGVVLICGTIYLLCLLVGYDSYAEICFLPSAVASHFQGLSQHYLSFVLTVTRSPSAVAEQYLILQRGNIS
jgi:hypothetical protein